MHLLLSSIVIAQYIYRQTLKSAHQRKYRIYLFIFIFSNDSSGNTIYAPNFNAFCNWSLSNITINPKTIDQSADQYIGTTIIDHIVKFDDDEVSKFTSFQNGICYWENENKSANCFYLDKFDISAEHSISVSGKPGQPFISNLLPV